MSRASFRVGGVDGCRGGWVLAVVGPDPGGAVELTVVSRFESVVDIARSRRFAALGVDIPIGYPVDGVKTAESEGRRRLGARRSSLFPTPVHAVLAAADWDEALASSRRVSGKGLSRQAFNLVARSREVRSIIRPTDQPWCSEVHPELAFTTMAGEPLAESKKSELGRRLRRQLVDRHIAAQGGSNPMAGIERPSGVGVAADDVLDACAAAWSARRLALGRAEWLGGGFDPDGYSLAIAV